MRVAKKIALDIGVAAVLAVLALIVAALVGMQRPDCVTCGSTVGLTLWVVALGAFQPVLWARGIGTRRRLRHWIFAFVLGAGSYLLLEWAAGMLLAAGLIGAAISLGFAANPAGEIVGVVSSWVLTRRERLHFKTGAT